MTSPKKAAVAKKGAPASGSASKPTADVAAMLAAAKGGAQQKKTEESPVQLLWNALDDETRQAVRAIATEQNGQDQAKQLVLRGINDLARNRDFLGSAGLGEVVNSAQVQTAIRSFPKGIKGLKKVWSDTEVRVAGRAVLQAIFPDQLATEDGFGKGPPMILDYLSPGACFGEMGVVTNRTRSASCVAYDHPPDDSGRKAGLVELVRIPSDVFRHLLEESPEIDRSVMRLVDERQKEMEDIGDDPVWDSAASVLAASEFRDAGFVQGQQLLLVDLESCTRCGDCIRAFMEAHDDGFSRLFLDGPRFDRFLVPSACRNCLNPACMIGCPVGSIQRGDDGQIDIRDWCIGCGLCADQYPYDSIRMHDIGIVPAGTVGWKLAPKIRLKGLDWQRLNHHDNDWYATSTPVRWDLDFRTRGLVAATAGAQASEIRFDQPLIGRYVFSMSGNDLKSKERFKISLQSEAAEIELWLNGTAVNLT